MQFLRMISLARFEMRKAVGDISVASVIVESYLP
jgi:hypothetical protein